MSQLRGAGHNGSVGGIPGAVLDRWGRKPSDPFAVCSFVGYQTNRLIALFATDRLSADISMEPAQLESCFHLNVAAAGDREVYYASSNHDRNRWDD